MPGKIKKSFMYKNYATQDKSDDEFDTTMKTSSHRKQKRQVIDSRQTKRPAQSYQYEYIYETLSDDSDKIKF